MYATVVGNLMSNEEYNQLATFGKDPIMWFEDDLHNLITWDAVDSFAIQTYCRWMERPIELCREEPLLATWILHTCMKPRA